MNTNAKTWLKMGLALLMLVELGVAGYWVSYFLQKSQQGLSAVGIISREPGRVVETWVGVEVVLSALGWLALINAIAILFTALYVRNSVKFPLLPLIFLIGSIALSIRGALLSIRELTWLFVIGIVAAVAVAVAAIWAYKTKAS
jgi:hypothetical protein